MSSTPAGSPLDRLLARLREFGDVNESAGGQYTARCPAHDDDAPSLSIGTGDDGRVLVHCFAGCDHADILRQLGIPARDLFPPKPRATTSSRSRRARQQHANPPSALYPSVKAATAQPQPDGALGEIDSLEGNRAAEPQGDGTSTVARAVAPTVARTAGLTLEELADVKHLPIEFLRGEGCANGTYALKGSRVPAVRIPYRGERGQMLRRRYRLALTGDDRFRWGPGKQAFPYGLHRLDEARRAGRLLLVEGESDCWTVWLHGLSALGVPGKSSWRSDWARHLAGLDVVVWQEPDAEDLVDRLARDLPALKVIEAPPGTKDLSEAHVRGDDVPALFEQIWMSARPVADVLRERSLAGLAELERAAAPLLDAEDPLLVLKKAIAHDGYGGDSTPVVITYLAATSRLLAMRRGAMPVHLLLVGPSGSGKSYAIGVVQRFLPPEAYVVIHAGSPRVLIHGESDLRHRALVFGEADSLPAGEDNPAASAVRNLLQDHALRYEVTIRDPETGGYTVRQIDRPGPTVMITTSTRRLGAQLDTRLFSLDVPDEPEQVRQALRAQARIELAGAAKPSEGLIAAQAYLQALAPWDVVVPFADGLAAAIGRSVVAARILRDYARLIAFVKSVTILRHKQRARDARDRLIATLDDYAVVHATLGATYRATVSGAGESVRKAVAGVTELKAQSGSTPITFARLATHLGAHKSTATRNAGRAILGGWLVNTEDRPNHPAALDLGEPLPDDDGLPAPDPGWGCTVAAFTDGKNAHCVFDSSDDSSATFMDGGSTPVGNGPTATTPPDPTSALTPQDRERLPATLARALPAIQRAWLDKHLLWANNSDTNHAAIDDDAPTSFSSSELRFRQLGFVNDDEANAEPRP